MRDEKVDEVNGDGREVLEDQKDQPGVFRLTDTAQSVRHELLIQGSNVAKSDVQHQRLTLYSDTVVAK